MKWSEEAWQSVSDIYRDIIGMPFIRELITGELPKEKFCFYISQDAHYLEQFGRTLATVGAKSYDNSDAAAYMRFAQNALAAERSLHESYFRDFKVADKGTMQPACHHYTHYLKSVAAFEPVETAMAAVLPCFWIYKETGDFIYQRQDKNNPYQKWIDVYSGEEFGTWVREAIGICDKAADNTTPAIRVRMTEAFITAAHMEYYFWEAAYELRMWK